MKFQLCDRTESDLFHFLFHSFFMQYLRNECLFFWVHGEWIVARDKQIAWTAKRFSIDLFLPRYDSFPMNPEKKDTHSLYLQCFQQKPFLKFSEKSYKFKIPTVTAIDLHLMYKSLRKWFGPTAELFVDSIHREMNWKILAGFNEGNMEPL